MNGMCACGCGREAARQSVKDGWRPKCGYSAACYKRWADHGYPPEGPPPPQMGTGPKADRAGRIEDYAFLRERGLSRLEAAARLGVVRRTAERYEMRLRVAS